MGLDFQRRWMSMAQLIECPQIKRSGKSHEVRNKLRQWSLDDLRSDYRRNGYDKRPDMKELRKAWILTKPDYCGRFRHGHNFLCQILVSGFNTKKFDLVGNDNLIIYIYTPLFKLQKF